MRTVGYIEIATGKPGARKESKVNEVMTDKQYLGELLTLWEKAEAGDLEGIKRDLKAKLEAYGIKKELKPKK